MQDLDHEDHVPEGNGDVRDHNADRNVLRLLRRIRRHKRILQRGRIVIGLMTSNRKLKASREGSKWRHLHQLRKRLPDPQQLLLPEDRADGPGKLRVPGEGTDERQRERMRKRERACGPMVEREDERENEVARNQSYGLLPRGLVPVVTVSAR